MQIEAVPLLRDNYAWLLTEGDEAAIIDPSEAGPVLEKLNSAKLHLRYIVNTHHHGDHCGGNLGLKAATDAEIIGPAYDRERIPGIDKGIDEGTGWSFGDHPAQVLFIPGHTRGHIALYFPQARALFCGDTLFSMGCGRLFEGTPAQMWHSLLKLRGLPRDTRIYCGHEYTEANCRFALTIEPENEALKQYAEKVEIARRAGLPTLPSSLGMECDANPFLRADNPLLARQIGGENKDSIAIFAEIRSRKDNF